ncbi:hypothetical protein TNCV_787181 [Trichonephila clavipes]|uniref:Uncharacterized protein n=1 Tax=Trichonephila clavipes TaxID=2585209 RepID=A0A8X6V245_TRICX|nr:hypothetical protein TNCV_787181 [Trichonephila clavipes]
MMTQRTAPWENWHLERGFELLRTFGLVRWGLGGSGHVEGGAWMGSCIAERGALPRPLLVAESGASPAKLVF